MIQYLFFVTSKLLNISDITKRIGNFFKLPIQLSWGFAYPELALKGMFPSTTGVDDVCDDLVKGCAQVFSLDGQKIIDVDAESLDLSHLPHGIYILKSGNKVKKIMR